MLPQNQFGGPFFKGGRKGNEQVAGETGSQAAVIGNIRVHLPEQSGKTTCIPGVAEGIAAERYRCPVRFALRSQHLPPTR